MRKLGIAAAVSLVAGAVVLSTRAEAADQDQEEKTPGADPAPGFDYLGAMMRKPLLVYFQPDEFGAWYPQMSDDLLIKLDEFREEWGAPVEVSPVPGAIGRHDDSGSQHNVEKWGEVRAIDVFPKVETVPGYYRYIETAEERQRAHDIAKRIGFTGIGVYLDTEPGSLVHLDVRRAPLVFWSRIEGEYHYGVVA